MKNRCGKMFTPHSFFISFDYTWVKNIYKKKKYCHIRAQLSQTNSFLSNNTFCRGAARRRRQDLYVTHCELIFFFIQTPIYSTRIAHYTLTLTPYIHTYIIFPTINMRPHTKCVGIFIKKGEHFYVLARNEKFSKRK